MGRDNSKSNFELLSKMRLRIKGKNRLGETEANNNDQLEFKKAINFLEEIEEESKFARKRFDAVAVVARATAQLSFQRHQQLSGGIGTGRTGREPQFHIAEGGIGSHCWVGRRQQI